MSEDDRIPRRVDLERALLGGLILDPEKLSDVPFLKAADFFLDDHANVFRAIKRLADSGRGIDAFTVSAETDGDPRPASLDMMNDLLDAAQHAAYVVEHAAIVRELAMRRRLIDAASRALTVAGDRSCSVADTIAALQELAFDVESFGGREVDPFDEQLLGAADLIAKRSESDTVGLPTGLVELDHYLGGLVPGQMIVVAARPGMGKSALGQSIVRHAAGLGLRSYVASLEMTGVEWSMRMIQAEASVSVAAIKPGNYTPEQQARVGAAYDTLLSMRHSIVIDDTPTRTIGDIVASARREKARGGLSLVVIDYLQLIDATPDTGRTANRQEQVAHVSRRIKAAAKELDVPIVALAQLNRESVRTTDKRPGLHDLRESGQIEQDADAVLLLHRPCYYEPEDKPGVAQVNIAKNRNGATRLVELEFVEEFTRFGDYTPPTGFTVGAGAGRDDF
jgi:replicative DNA helicase